MLGEHHGASYFCFDTQLCPIAKAAEVLCERWTLLIIREMLIGSTRYSEFQRAISKMSPTLLSKRLLELEKANLVMKRKMPGGRSHEYHLTKAGKELEPIIVNMGSWGMQWARDQMGLDDQDVELLMWDIQRNLKSNKMPANSAVLKFHFSDLAKHAGWWIIINNDEQDLCTDDPQKDVDLYFTSEIQVLIDIWMGDRTLRDALRLEDLKLVGNSSFKNSINNWFGLSLMAPYGRALSASG